MKIYILQGGRFVCLKITDTQDILANILYKDVIEFLGLWETIHNPDFKPLEFEGFRQKSGYNAFTLSPKRWADTTSAIGIYSKAGRYGGTYAHRDIAFEFASWISAEFNLYIITDYQRLKNDENSRLSLNWNMNREIAKINYRIHTDAIKEHLMVPGDIHIEKNRLPDSIKEMLDSFQSHRAQLLNFGIDENTENDMERCPLEIMFTESNLFKCCEFGKIDSKIGDD